MVPFNKKIVFTELEVPLYLLNNIHQYDVILSSKKIKDLHSMNKKLTFKLTTEWYGIFLM